MSLLFQQNIAGSTKVSSRNGMNSSNSSISFKSSNSSSSSAKWQFVGTLDQGENGGFMLNTDFALFYDLQVDRVGKLKCNLNTTCGLTNSCQADFHCLPGDTFDLARQYAQVCMLYVCT